MCFKPIQHLPVRNSRHAWIQDWWPQRRGSGPDFGLPGETVYAFVSSPMLRSSGQFPGRDFSPDFGRRFDDANLVSTHGLIRRGRFRGRHFDDRNLARNPYRKRAPGYAKMATAAAHIRAQIGDRNHPMPVRRASATNSRASKWSSASESRRSTSTRLGLASSRADQQSIRTCRRHRNTDTTNREFAFTRCLELLNLNTNSALLSRGPKNDDHFSALFSHPKPKRVYAESRNSSRRNLVHGARSRMVDITISVAWSSS